MKKLRNLIALNKHSTILTSLISILLGVGVGALMMLVAGYDPIKAYSALFAGSMLKTYDLGETIRTISPLILTGLAVALAFRTGLFNIGVEGQFIIGQLVALIVGVKLQLPFFIHVVVAVIAGGLASALWGAIVGLLKALRGVHEVISSIMMNFIALNLANLCIRTWLGGGSDSTPEIPSTASLQMEALSHLFGNARIHLGIVIALLAVFAVHFFLSKTRRGYELRAVGFNQHASRYAGINVKRNMVLSMSLSGLLAGLAGVGEVLGTSGYMSIQGAFNGVGFDGIAVALLGANTALGVVFSSLLFGVLTYGGGNMQFDAGVPFEVIRVVFAAIILFVSANTSLRLMQFFNRKVRKTND